MIESTASHLEPSTWRLASRLEVMEFVDNKQRNKHGSFLIVRSKLKPVDVYTYLYARFGEPNGIQNILRSDSSDNWIHWDYNLKAGAADVYISGTSRECHLLISEKMKPHDWASLLTAIKRHFGSIASEKSKVLRQLEKFLVFQNKFVSIANLCADLHESIIDVRSTPTPSETTSGEGIEALYAPIQEKGRKAAVLYGDCLKLRLLMPVMAEAFINLLILTFCKREVRDDAEAYKAFLRETIPDRLNNLRINCLGFDRAIDTKTDAYAAFMRVIQRRNFDLHGNMDPEREPIETVYFDGKRPLFVEPGHHIEKFFGHLEAVHLPDEVIDDYENVHLFLVELTQYLQPEYRSFFERVSSDPFPGFEVKKRAVTSILPEQLMMCILPDVLYDDDLMSTDQSSSLS